MVSLEAVNIDILFNMRVATHDTIFQGVFILLDHYKTCHFFDISVQVANCFIRVFTFLFL
jgi:hypothetical protein